MFKGSYQRKLLTVLYSGGSNPYEIWSIHVKNGWTRRVKDEDLGCIVCEICGTNVATAYLMSPPDPRATLAITLPFITMFIKNLKRYFTFEIQILDDKNMRRRFRFSNYQSSTKVRPFTCSVPLSLKPGWNQMQLNLANFTTRAYGTNYLETQRVQIHANCRIRRVYFSDKLYIEEELPKEYRIYQNIRQVTQQTSKERVASKLEAEERRLSQASKPASILKQPSQPSQPSYQTIRTAVSELMGQTSLRTVSNASTKHESNLLSKGSRSVIFVPPDEVSNASTKHESNLLSKGSRSVIFVPPDEVVGQEEQIGSIQTNASRKSQKTLSRMEERMSMSAIAEEREPQTPEVEEREIVEAIDYGKGEGDMTESPEESPTGDAHRTRTMESVSPRSDILESEVTESEPPLDSDAELLESEAEYSSPDPPPTPELEETQNN